MEESFTLNESELNDAVEFVVNKIAKWTSSEISKLAFSNDEPRCVAISNSHYRVGNYTIKQQDEYCWRVTYDAFEHDFMFKKSAIFYCLAQQFGKFELAYRILDSDQKLADHSNDFNLFQLRLKGDTADKWKRQFYLSRKKQAHSRCLAARTQLQKSLKLAKYYKLWKPII